MRSLWALEKRANVERRRADDTLKGSCREYWIGMVARRLTSPLPEHMNRRGVACNADVIRHHAGDRVMMLPVFQPSMQVPWRRWLCIAPPLVSSADGMVGTTRRE
jgi:hypothetical protein